MLHRSGGWWQSGSSPHDDLQTLLRLTNHSQSIAVVGASGNLLHRAYGADIDAHDIVIRVNQAPAWPPDGRPALTLRVLHQVAFQQTSGVLQPGEAIVWTGTHLGVDGSPPEWLREVTFQPLVDAGLVLAINGSFIDALREVIDPLVRLGQRHLRSVDGLSSDRLRHSNVAAPAITHTSNCLRHGARAVQPLLRANPPAARAAPGRRAAMDTIRLNTSVTRGSRGIGEYHTPRRAERDGFQITRTRRHRHRRHLRRRCHRHRLRAAAAVDAAVATAAAAAVAAALLAAALAAASIVAAVATAIASAAIIAIAIYPPQALEIGGLGGVAVALLSLVLLLFYRAQRARAHKERAARFRLRVPARIRDATNRRLLRESIGSRDSRATDESVG